MNDPGSKNAVKTALVTGASAGLGHEFAKLFARDGYNLVIVARNRDKLVSVAEEIESTSNTRVVLLQKDLGDPDAPAAICEELDAASITIDALVNNAGFGTNGAFHEINLQRELEMIEVHIKSAVHLIGLLLPGMVQRKRGRIMNVSSTAAFQPGPFMATYYATKAYLLSFSEAIAEELRGTGVTVTAFCAGPTQTEFQKRANMEETKIAGKGMMMDAKTVAGIGYKAMMKGKTVVIPGLKNRILAFPVRFAPRRLVTRVVRGLNENRKPT